MTRDELKPALEWADALKRDKGQGQALNTMYLSALASALREAWAEIDHHIETLKERDDYITDLRCEMDRLKEQYARIVVKTKRFEEGNCPLCGYNGPGYFQPDKHPCAKYYHEAGINPSLDEALNSGDGREKG